MSNHNHDNMNPEDIKPPPRMPKVDWDKFEIDIKKGKEDGNRKGLPIRSIAKGI